MARLSPAKAVSSSAHSAVKSWVRRAYRMGVVGYTEFELWGRLRVVVVVLMYEFGLEV